MHRATQLLSLIFPLCSFDMHVHRSVMGFWSGKTVDGDMAFTEHKVVCLHSSSSFIPLAFKKLCPLRKGMGGNIWEWSWQEAVWFFPICVSGSYRSSLPQGRSYKWENWRSKMTAFIYIPPLLPVPLWHCAERTLALEDRQCWAPQHSRHGT